MAKRYYWLKLKDDFFTNKRIKKLRSIAGGDTYTIIYLKMQLLSLKNEGKLYFDGVDESFADELSLELDEDVENVKITIQFLLKNGLLIEETRDEYVLPETKECIGSETDKAQMMRNLRSKKRYLEELKREKNNSKEVTKLLDCYSDVTKCYTEIDIEKEKEIDIDKEIDNKKKKEVYFENEEVNNLFLEFLDIRKKIKAVNSDLAIKKLVNKLNKYEDNVKSKMLENSIVNSWKDVYELKEKKETALEKLQREIREAEEEERKQQNDKD